MISITALAVALTAAATGAVAQAPFFLSPVLIQNDGRCLQASSNADGASLTIQDCTGAPEQEWTFSNGQVSLFGSSTTTGAKCLDVSGGNTASGAALQIWSCDATHSNANQQWYYTGDKHLAWTSHSTCLDLTNGNAQAKTCNGNTATQIWDVGYPLNALPYKSENGQTGFNNCTAGPSSQSSSCQTAWINSLDDFCLFAPPEPNSEVGETESLEVAWCTKSGRGTRVMPAGTITGAHFIRTPDYVQITGVGDFTKINIRRGDEGGELDPHGADGNGNPVGGLIYGSTFGAGRQYHEWAEFISYNEFCIKVCIGPNAARNCQHIYDVMGCAWNMPGDYSTSFSTCDGDDTEPPGVYGTSTWYQGVSPTPLPHSAGASSNCVAQQTIGGGTVPPTTTPTPTTTTPTTAPTTTPTTTPTAGVHPSASGSKCLTAASDSDGAAVTIQDCNGSAAQAWIASGGTFKTLTNKCLDLTNGVNANGTKLQVWTCFAGSANQAFSVSGGTITLANTGKCVDLTDGSLANSNPIQVWDCSAGNANQQWSIN